MAKTENIQAVGRIDYNGGVFLPGDTFDCDLKEAKRLKDLGVAAVPAAQIPAGPTPEELAEQALAAAMQAQAALIDQLRAAADLDALNALIDPATETRPAVIDAYTERADELEGAVQ